MYLLVLLATLIPLMQIYLLAWMPHRLCHQVLLAPRIPPPPDLTPTAFQFHVMIDHLAERDRPVHPTYAFLFRLGRYRRPSLGRRDVLRFLIVVERVGDSVGLWSSW